MSETSGGWRKSYQDLGCGHQWHFIPNAELPLDHWGRTKCFARALWQAWWRTQQKGAVTK